jgi:hypothetical protein
LPAPRVRPRSRAQRKRESWRVALKLLLCARALEDGTYEGRLRNGRLFAGDWEGPPLNGPGEYGVARSEDGVRFAGRWTRGGGGYDVGVLYFSESSEGLRYEGEWLAGQRHGYGQYVWRNGNRYLGSFVDGQRSGAGVLFFANGNRFEGAFSDGFANGHGVMWDPEGRVLAQGVWSRNRLTSPIGVQGGG